MTEPKRVAIVDDHTMFRKSLSGLINLLPGYSVVLDASNGRDFIQQLQQRQLPDIVLLDIKMAEMDGYAAAAWIRGNYPEMRVLALSTMDGEAAIIKMISNGARGYLLKDAEPAELKRALDEVVSIGYYYNDLVTRKVMRSLRDVHDTHTDMGKLMGLSEKELEFLRLVCSERTYQQIASEMCLSERTIDGYRDQLFKKLNVTSRVGLVLYAVKNDLVQL